MARYVMHEPGHTVGLEALAEMIARAQAEVVALSNGDRRWRMSVPVDDADSDMVIGDALRHAKVLVAVLIKQLPVPAESAESTPVGAPGSTPQEEHVQRRIAEIKARAAVTGHASVPRARYLYDVNYLLALIEPVEVAPGTGETPNPPTDALRTFAEECERLPEVLTALLRDNGYVFERFPRNLVEEPPTSDGERWEAMAFSLYSRLAEVSSHAIHALNEADEAADVAGVVSPQVSQPNFNESRSPDGDGQAGMTSKSAARNANDAAPQSLSADAINGRVQAGSEPTDSHLTTASTHAIPQGADAYVSQPCQVANPKGGRCWRASGHEGPHDWERPTCPRCLSTADHSPDDKECSDHCITRHQATIAALQQQITALTDQLLICQTERIALSRTLTIRNEQAKDAEAALVSLRDGLRTTIETWRERAPEDWSRKHVLEECADALAAVLTAADPTD